MRAYLRLLTQTTLLTLSLMPLTGALPVFAQDTAPPDTAPEPKAPPRDNLSWTTYKGDNQRSGFSDATLSLPLNLSWRFTTDGPGRPYNSTPLVLGPPGQQKIYFAVGRNIYCVDAATGQQEWRSINLHSLVVTPITLLSGEGGDYILAGGQSGRLTALRTADGVRAWESDVRSSLSNSGPIVVDTNAGKRIICAIGSGRLIAYTPEGQVDPEWEVKLGRFGSSPSSSMALSPDGTQLFLTASDGRLYVINCLKGELVYSVQLASSTNVMPMVTGRVVVLTTSRAVSGLRTQDGNLLWSFTPRSAVVSSPAAGKVGDKPAVFFGTQNGIFNAISADKGLPLWRADVQASISGPALVTPDKVIFGTRNGQVVALSATDGSLLWRYRLKTERQVLAVSGRAAAEGEEGGGAPAEATGTEVTVLRTYGVTSAPAVVNGQLFVLGDNASLYSFSSAPFDANPPRLIQPSLALPDEDNRITSLLLSPDNPPVVPGRSPMYLAVEIEDSGSGIDARSIQVLVDGAPLAAEAISFQVETGNLTATLLATNDTTGFTDGLKNLTIIVKDYAGNVLQFTGSFSVDNQAPPPTGQARHALAEAPGAAPAEGGPGF